MKYDPNARQRLDRVDRQKGNRTRPVDVLPDRAEHGDRVYLIPKSEFHTWLNGKWEPEGIESATPSTPSTFTDALRQKLESIQAGAQVNRTLAQIRSIIDNYVTATLVKMLYESNPDTNAFTDALLAKLNGIEAGATAGPVDVTWDDILSKPDLYDTTEIFRENVSVPAPLQFVELNASYPDVADADVLLVDVDGKDTIRVRIASVLSKPARIAGDMATTANSVCKAGDDLFNLVYFGRTSANRILFSTGDADGDNMAFNPNPLIIEQIDKKEI